MDPQLESREKIPDYGMETYKIATQKQVQISIISEKNYVGTVSGCPRSNFGTLPRQLHKSKQCVTVK
jgi:hypothetical protein